ncbi:glycosyltransferase family 4 protein [Rubripirellula amarantea]|nr:glycosyltransferase family 4 protein [Rubripirellula amarantea]
MNQRTVIIHDYAGHPFQVELSRYLASVWKDQGIRVIHAFSSSTHTPQGSLQVTPDDPPNFEVVPLSLGKMIQKYRFVDRFISEKKYGRLLCELCEQREPEAVLSGNTPTVAQLMLVNWCNRNNARVATWIQDMYGVAAKRVLSKKIPVLGGLAGNYLIHLDGKSYRQSDSVIPITEDFTPLLLKQGVDASKIQPIHNWAPLDEMPQMPRDNGWSQSMKLGDEPRFIYSGTLSVRHNPQLLLDLAIRLDKEKRGRLIVISEGEAADWLAEHSKKLPSLSVLPFQPFSQLPMVLGAADVLLAILEPDAGVFCVPSKILTYLCAGRALLTAIPHDNLAARLIRDLDVGLNTSATESEPFVRMAMELAADNERRQEMGERARQYAEKEFDIAKIGKRFAAELGIPVDQECLAK